MSQENFGEKYTSICSWEMLSQMLPIYKWKPLMAGNYKGACGINRYYSKVGETLASKF